MEWTAIITSLVSAISAVVVAIIANGYKKQAAAEEKRAERRKKESLLNLKMTEATLELSSVTAEALTGGQLNGNVERAKQKAKAAREEYEEYAHEIVIEELLNT